MTLALLNCEWASWGLFLPKCRERGNLTLDEIVIRETLLRTVIANRGTAHGSRAFGPVERPDSRRTDQNDLSDRAGGRRCRRGCGVTSGRVIAFHWQLVFARNGVVVGLRRSRRGGPSRSMPTVLAGGARRRSLAPMGFRVRRLQRRRGNDMGRRLGGADHAGASRSAPACFAGWLLCRVGRPGGVWHLPSGFLRPVVSLRRSLCNRRSGRARAV